MSINSLFLFIAEQYSILWMYYHFFIHSPMMNMWVVSNCKWLWIEMLNTFSFFVSTDQEMSSFLLGKYGVGLLNYKISVWLSFIYTGVVTILYSNQQFISYPENYLNALISSNRFFVDSLRFSTIMLLKKTVLLIPF